MLTNLFLCSRFWKWLLSPSSNSIAKKMKGIEKDGRKGGDSATKGE